MYNMTRSGCRDIWNAYMCKNTVFTSKDIPICPSTAKRIPSEMILWDEAKYLYKKTISNGQQEFIFDK